MMMMTDAMVVLGLRMTAAAAAVMTRMMQNTALVIVDNEVVHHRHHAELGIHVATYAVYPLESEFQKILPHQTRQPSYSSHDCDGLLLLHNYY